MPRIPRMVVTDPGQKAAYHVISRTALDGLKKKKIEKDKLVSIIQRLSTIYVVQVLGFVVMSNHFHLLVEVSPVSMVSDDEVRQRFRLLYGKDAEFPDELLEDYRERFCSLSAYVKDIKQSFSLFYNKRKNRKGTLWGERFKSVIVQKGSTLINCLAYIDLNPIRAAIVQNPEDYKWCSYGEAARPNSNKLARAGLRRVLGMSQKTVDSSDEPEESESMMERYRVMLFSDGEEVFTDKPETGEVHQRVRNGFKREQVKGVLDRGGKLTFGETLRCRVRYFSDGMTVGSREFVDGLFQSSRERFSEKRKSGARPMRGVGWKEKQFSLYSMRQLGKDHLG